MTITIEDLDGLPFGIFLLDEVLKELKIEDDQSEGIKTPLIMRIVAEAQYRGKEMACALLKYAIFKGYDLNEREVWVDNKTLPRSLPRNNATALHEAAWTSSFEMISILLEHGANPNLKDDGGRTPLNWFELSDNQLPEVRAILEKAMLNSGSDVCPKKAYRRL